MPAKVLSAALVGIDAVPVEVEADVAQGLPAFNLVGLPDAAVRESRERVRAAVRSAGIAFPRTRVTVNLAPADLRKEGPAFDVAIACAVLLAAGRVEFERDDGTTDDARDVPPHDPRTLLVGELGLDGAIRPVAGILPIALACRRLGIPTLICPEANAEEAAVVDGITVVAARHLLDVVQLLLRQRPLTPYVRRPAAPQPVSADDPYDLSRIHGLESGKRALIVAASGSHHLLLTGPPGSGKSLLARSLRTILPPLTDAERIEVTAIHSIVGLVPAGGGLVIERPFRSPHHTASTVAIIGGGASPRPGEISLAHRGVLFLDELPEFDRDVLESLRQPIEDGVVHVSRAAGTLVFPAQFQLVAAQNPCPCGYWRDPHHPCACAPGAILKYQRKLSGPLLDRIDLTIDVPRQPTEQLLRDPTAAPSAVARDAVVAARERQARRSAVEGVPATNAELRADHLRRVAPLGDAARQTLLQAAERYHLSARATIRCLRCARTIADLAGSDEVTADHVGEALRYRPKVAAFA